MEDQLEQPAETLDSGADVRPDAAQWRAVDEEDADPDTDALNNEGNEPDEEFDDVEVDGKKYQLPKTAAEKLKSERLMHGDYTRKTQELAEQRKQIEAQGQQLQRARQSQQEHLQDMAKVVAIDQQLRQIAELDWNRLIDEDPATAQKLQMNQQRLQQERQAAQAAITKRDQEAALSEQQSFAKRVQDAEAYMQREIQGWSAERSNQLASYAKKDGIDSTALAKALVDVPHLAKYLHKAELYDRLQERQAKGKASSAEPPKVEAKPVPRVGAGAKGTKDPLNMTDTEFAAMRRAQIKHRR